MKKILLVHIFIFLSICVCCQAPNWVWAKKISYYNNPYDAACTGIKTDNSGNFYIVGAGKNGTHVIMGIDTFRGIFTSKFDAGGNLIWARGNNAACAIPYGISIDKAYNIYITGVYEDQNLSFGNIIINNLHYSSPLHCEIFIAKYDSSGNPIWAHSYGGVLNDFCRSITNDAFGNVYIAGYFLSPSISFGNTILTNTGSGNLFITKFDSSGNILWAKSTNGTNNCTCWSIGCDKAGNAFISGTFAGSITFDTITLNNSNSSCESYIAKFDSSGHAIWARNAIGTVSGDFNNLTVENHGNSYISGMFSSSSLTFGNISINNSSNFSIYIAKYDSSGNALWATNIGGTSPYELSVSSDTIGNLYLAGACNDSIIFGSNTMSGYGPFIIKYDTNGNFIWIKSASCDSSGFNIGFATASACNTAGDIYVSGGFGSDTIGFGNFFLTYPYATPVWNGSQIFIAKLQSSPTSTLNIAQDDLLILYPNPSSGNLTVKFPYETKYIQVSNSLGQILERRNVNNQTEANFTIRENGIYFIKIVGDGETVTKKLIINN